MGLLDKNKSDTQDGPKKSFWETGFGKFCQKVKDKVPDLAGDILEVATSPRPLKASIELIKGKLKEKSLEDPRNVEIAKLMQEMDKFSMTWEKEMFTLETADRQSARTREVEIAKTGKIDWMMIFAGATALCAFIFIVVTAVFMPAAFKNNPILVHITGMVEGAALTVFYYYYGTSRSSAQKTEVMADKIKNG